MNLIRSSALPVAVFTILLGGVAVPRADELSGHVPPAAVPEAVPVPAPVAPAVRVTQGQAATPASEGSAVPTEAPSAAETPAGTGASSATAPATAPAPAPATATATAPATAPPRPTSPATANGTGTAAPAQPIAEPATLVVPANPAAPQREPVRVGPPRYDAGTGRWVAPLGAGRATLTLDARLQERLERTLEGYRVPYGATVLLEPRTGRVLALAEHSRAEPGRRDLPLTAMAPAASVFKIVTAAALLEKGAADGEVCWHGGRRRLDPKLLRDDPRRDRRCSSLVSAFGHSTNVVFAKLADRDLDPGTLRSTAERFLFNVPIEFPRPVEMSTAKVPDEAFAAANTAAGFGAVRLSPLHGALLAAIVANGGVYVPPVLVEDAKGAPLPLPGAPVRIVDEQIAAKLAEMMRETVAAGTARKAFRRPASALRGVAVAGKTGSLADHTPFRDYSWFVGYAPADRPEVAVAALVVNDRLWHARAAQVAREALEAYFASRTMHAGSGAVKTAAVR